ncbi:helix-turn-helix domain-containing protein [Streptomyces sp. NPDC096079]|uniref:helix-turn-helix domain-containing protein n=1 Tax=Streptomyces sp. NPDC096079 TaxID=3155820 RepID=UPI00331C8BE9
MTEVARTQGSSAAVERGEVPEAAALGNVLKGLFTRLGISQNQYAYRVHLDKSAVSRYLSGRRVAPQDFIDRLVREVEEHAGAPLRLEAKDSLRGQRLEALRVCSPDEFRLESLRDELARSRRDTERAHRTIEALHALLDKKEAEARDVTDELTRLRLDWGAERAALARAREELLREVERLGEDLTDAEHLRAEAERHGEELRETVLRLEEELSRHGSGDLPLEAFKDRLREMWEEEMLPEASRELTEAAWSRSLEDVVHLTHWLGEEAESFARDVARLRPLEDVLAFASLMAPPEAVRLGSSWKLAVAARVTPGNAHAVLQAMGDEAGGELIVEAVRRMRSHRNAAALVSVVLSDVESMAVLPNLSIALATRPGDPYGLRMSVELVAARRVDVAADLLAGAMKWRPRGGFVRYVEDMDDVDVDALFDLVMSSDRHTVVEFAAHLAHTDESPMCRRFLAALADRGMLDHVHGSAHPPLRQAVTRWRSSRGQ